jgi:hypothetical protein
MVWIDSGAVVSGSCRIARSVSGWLCLRCAPDRTTSAAIGVSGVSMAEDLLDAIRDQLANFAVGLVQRVEGARSRVIGSGVLVSIEGRRGILTCGHVLEQYDKLPEIGLTRFIAGAQQRRIVDITDAHHIIVQSSDQWTEEDIDLAFTYLNPEVADSIAAQSVFLNIERNRGRIGGGEPTDGHCVDVMFGLVAEYSGKPVIEGGRFISPMRAVIIEGRCTATKMLWCDFRQSTTTRRNCRRILVV